MEPINQKLSELPIIRDESHEIDQATSSLTNWNRQRIVSAASGVALFALGAVATLRSNKVSLGVSGMYAGWQFFNSAWKTENEKFSLKETVKSVGVSSGIGIAIECIPTVKGTAGYIEKKVIAVAAAGLTEGIRQYRNDSYEKGKLVKAGLKAIGNSLIGDGASLGANLCTNVVSENLGPMASTIVPHGARGFLSGIATSISTNWMEGEEQSFTGAAVEGLAGGTISAIAAVPLAREKAEKAKQKPVAAEEAKPKAKSEELKENESSKDKPSQEVEELKAKLKKLEEEKHSLEQKAKLQELEKEKQLQKFEREKKLQEQKTKLQELESLKDKQLREVNQERMQGSQQLAQNEARLNQQARENQAKINGIKVDLRRLEKAHYKDRAHWRRGNHDAEAHDIANGRKVEFRRKDSIKVLGGDGNPLVDLTNEFRQLEIEKARFESDLKAKESTIRETVDKQIQQLKQDSIPAAEPSTTAPAPNVPATPTTPTTTSMPATAASATPELTSKTSKLDVVPARPEPVAETPNPSATPPKAAPASEPFIPNPIPPPFNTPKQPKPDEIEKQRTYKLSVQGEKTLEAFETADGFSNVLHALLGEPDERGKFRTDATKRRQEISKWLEKTKPKGWEAYRDKILDETKQLTMDDLQLAAVCFNINLLIHHPGWDVTKSPLQKEDNRTLHTINVNPAGLVQTVHVLHDGKGHFMQAEIVNGFNNS